MKIVTVMSRTVPRWQPVLTGALAEQACEAVAAIAASLDDSLRNRQSATAPPPARQLSLMTGYAGVSLYYAYLAPSAARWKPTAEAMLTQVMDAAPQAGLDASLCSGVAGVGWTVAHLASLGMVDGQRAESFCRWVDAQLLAEVERSPDIRAPDQYELLYGLVGLGVYLVERLPEPSAATLLRAIVEWLRMHAEVQPEGITWWTSPVHTRSPERYPHGWYNLGLAHGVPGVIAFLGLACAAGIAPDVARPLLDGAVAWLLAQRRQFEVGERFPILLGEGIEPEPGRLTWCYGHPGIAAALLLAARAVREPAWEQTALDLALGVAEREPEAAGLFDASLCHGAVGAGHILNRLWQATGEGRLGEAARSWLARGLEMRRPDGKLGGFSSLVQDQSTDTRRRIAFRGLLEGAAGIGLVLLAATTDVEPSWDRVLLLS